MARSARDVHSEASDRVIAMMGSAMRADGAAIRAVVEEAAGRGRLDTHTTEFLRRARASVLGACAALNEVLLIHRSTTNAYGVQVCASCGTTEACRTLQNINNALFAYRTCDLAEIDRAEAWRRADMWLNRDASHPLLIAIEELPDGYVAWPVPQPRSAGDKTLLVVDKRTGRLTRWPPLPKEILARQYRLYLHGHPVGPDAPPGRA